MEVQEELKTISEHRTQKIRTESNLKFEVKYRTTNICDHHFILPRRNTKRKFPKGKTRKQ